MVKLCYFICTSLAAVCSTCTWRWYEQHNFNENSISGAAPLNFENRLHGAPVGGSVSSSFEVQLPRFATVQPLVGVLQGTSASKGVAIISLLASTRPPGEQVLGRAELAASLDGSYSDIKSVLGDVLERSPYLVVQRLSLRRTHAAATLEARVDFLLPMRPDVSQ